ncbi:tetratricopeptide repeat protein [Pseudolysobacter antarcticus]|uniref:tetratricopeptide repeat protein n=1 Tax=Pseudolysobacter antarcticus TaxID=2511995 RepID=UPI0013EE2811|nr:tetratricopeptide repeat protein [Pseudolysobacter antarcticus]
MEEFPANPLRIGDWCINPAAGQISRAGEIVRIEARAMRLLLCLAARAGQVELLNHVWAGVIVTPDSVYQAVTSLRRLLGDDARQPSYIATVPRLGYRMVAAVSDWVDPAADAVVELSPGLADRSIPASGEPSGSVTIEAKTQPSSRKKTVVIFAVTILAALMLAVAYLLLKRAPSELSSGTSTSATESAQSIGVLPFLDLTEEMDQEYFADGMTEELIDMLSKIPGLRVPARTSSFYFKGKQITIAEIAKTLGVAYVLEGSVRKSGKTLRVTAQLIRAENGYHVWSNTYDRSLDDILMVQDDIAMEVKKALLASLQSAAHPSTATAPNSAAYAAYFQARALRHGNRSRAQAQAIVDYLHQATRLDPAYAPAWAELARALVYQSTNQLVAADTIAAEAHEAASRALLLDPKLADAQLALGIVYAYLDWDWTAAEREYRNVLALEPGNAEVLALLSDIRRSLGNVEEALGLMQQAAALDPLDARYQQWLGEMNYSLGRLTAAESHLRKALDINPEQPVYALLAEVKLAASNTALALELLQHETDARARSAGLALVYFVLGRRAEADAELVALENRGASDVAFAIARIHAYRQEIDQAFVWLDRAESQRDPECSDIKNDPLLQNLRSDSRYKLLLQKMKLPE